MQVDRLERSVSNIKIRVGDVRLTAKKGPFSTNISIYIFLPWLQQLVKPLRGWSLCWSWYYQVGSSISHCPSRQALANAICTDRRQQGEAETRDSTKSHRNHLGIPIKQDKTKTKTKYGVMRSYHLVVAIRTVIY